MSHETISPIRATVKTVTAVGRPADRLAMILAAIGAGLSVITAIWFFLGFAENDTRPEHLTSALIFTILLFSFAVAPFALVAHFARRAFQLGSRPSDLYWTIFLMLPWTLLGGISIAHTPLPIWSGFIVMILSALLTIWAVVSLILDRKKRA